MIRKLILITGILLLLFGLWINWKLSIPGTGEWESKPNLLESKSPSKDAVQIPVVETLEGVQ